MGAAQASGQEQFAKEKAELEGRLKERERQLEEAAATAAAEAAAAGEKLQAAEGRTKAAAELAAQVGTHRLSQQGCLLLAVCCFEIDIWP